MGGVDRTYENRKLRAEWWRFGIAAAIAFLGVVVPLWLQVVAGRDRVEAARRAVLAQTGSAGECKRLAGVETPGEVFEFSATWPGSERFCEEFFGDQPPAIEVQRELVQQLADNPEQWRHILEAWEALYPDQEWAGNIVSAFHPA